jgi:ribose 5-phosphate isomerase B
MADLQTSESGPIWIGCDHGGYELKGHILSSTEIVRYQYYPAQVAEAILCGEAARGILICSTGVRMSIVAMRSRLGSSMKPSRHLAQKTHGSLLIQ